MAQEIDTKQWLKDNKLGEPEIYNIFVKRNIMIEELTQFNNDDLKAFADDIGLELLQKKRFIKGVERLKSKQNARRPLWTQTIHVCYINCFFYFFFFCKFCFLCIYRKHLNLLIHIRNNKKKKKNELKLYV